MLRQYIGPQSFWNERAVNEREKYYYGYGGYWGAGVSDNPADYRILQRSKIPCDALKQDCWSKPRDTTHDGPNGCKFELFDGGCAVPETPSGPPAGHNHPTGSFGFLGIIGIVALIAIVAHAATKRN